MTRALEGSVHVSPGLARLAREIQLSALLDDVAACAHARHGVTRLVIDRLPGLEGAHITAVIGALEATEYVDLWDLDPMLWDDANWAATRLLPEGEVLIVRARPQTD